MKEKGQMKGLIKDTLILFAITLIAGVLLGVVNELTKEPIAQQEIAAKATACGEVFYEADASGNMVEVVSLTFEELSETEVAALNEKCAGSYSSSITADAVYRALQADGSLYGYVIGITTKEGYGGAISFYMGVTADGVLKGVSLLSIAETPGLGMNAESVLIPQFRNVKADAFFVTKGGDGAQSDEAIDAITSATITSNAITNGVNAGMTCFRALTEGGNS